MKRLQTCCCCVNTRDGSIVVAVLGILLSIATIIGIWFIPSSIISFSTSFFEDKDKKYHISQIILTISLCFTVLICGLLIVAIKKRRSWLMLPWVVLGLVLAIGLLISILHTAIVLYQGGPDEDLDGSPTAAPFDETHGVSAPVLATIILIGGLLYLVLYLYLWVVVFSCYLDIRDEEERGRYSKSPYRR